MPILASITTIMGLRVLNKLAPARLYGNGSTLQGNLATRVGVLSIVFNIIGECISHVVKYFNYRYMGVLYEIA